jgi:hypothetical protein
MNPSTITNGNSELAILDLQIFDALAIPLFTVDRTLAIKSMNVCARTSVRTTS